MANNIIGGVTVEGALSAEQETAELKGKDLFSLLKTVPSGRLLPVVTGCKQPTAAGREERYKPTTIISILPTTLHGKQHRPHCC